MAEEKKNVKEGKQRLTDEELDNVVGGIGGDGGNLRDTIMQLGKSDGTSSEMNEFLNRGNNRV